MNGGVILHQLQPSCFSQSGLDPSSYRCPYGTDQHGGTPDQRTKNGWNSVSDLLHFRQALGGDVYTVDEKHESILLEAAEVDIFVSVV